MRRLPNPPEYEGAPWQDDKLNHELEDQVEVMLRLEIDDDRFCEVRSTEDGKFQTLWYVSWSEEPDIEVFETLSSAQEYAEEDHYDVWQSQQDWCQCSDPCCPCTGSKRGVP